MSGQWCNTSKDNKYIWSASDNNELVKKSSVVLAAAAAADVIYSMCASCAA